MKPEEKAEIIIYNWIRPYVNEIYFNRKNKLNAPIFKIKGKKKPDFIIKDKFGVYAVLEIKPTLKSNQIISGGKQLFNNYYVPYELEESKYYIDGKEILISYFLFCTEKSINGYLFNTPAGFVDNEKDIKKSFVVKNNMIPKIEEIRTKDFTRELFSYFKEYRKNNNKVFNAGLGVLILDIKNKCPIYFCIKRFNKYIQIKREL